MLERDRGPLERLDAAGAAGLPVGTIRDGGLRIDVARRLAAAGLAQLDLRSDRRPYGRAFTSQLSLPL